MAKKKQSAAEVIKPLVQVEGEKHILQEAYEAGEDLPIITAVGFMRVAPGSKDFVSYKLKVQGREVISIEVGEPNLKAIAEDEAKIAFVTSFIDQE